MPAVASASVATGSLFASHAAASAKASLAKVTEMTLVHRFTRSTVFRTAEQDSYSELSARARGRVNAGVCGRR